MNSIDLNIKNYNFSDILLLFNITNIHDKVNNLKLINEKLIIIKNNFDQNIYIFYIKSYKLIFFIYKLYEKHIILSLDDFNTINNIIKKITDIQSFEKLKIDDIISLNIIPLNKEDKVIVENKETKNQLLLNITNNLNEPYYNLGGGRVDPNLNNKTNTNIIFNSLPNKIAPGNLNSIKRITQNLNLNLNTCFRDNYYASSSTNFTYTIPKEIKNVTSLRLASIEIPNSCYIFSSQKKNNSFVMIVSQNNIVTNYDIIINDGNYDSDQLQTYLNNTYFYNSGIVNPLSNIQFSIDNFSFKSSFQVVTPDPDYFFSIEFTSNINQNIMTTFGWTIGFRIPNYLNIINSIESEGLYDGSGDKYVYFILTDYQYNNNNLNVICYDKCLNENDVLAKIPLTNGKLSIVINDDINPITKTRIYNGPVNINKIHVQVLDKFGEIVNLNNMDYSFTLELEILYECFNFNDVYA